MSHHFRGENTAKHRRGPVTRTGLLPTRSTLPHTHAQQQHRHHTPFTRYKPRSDNHQVYLALVSLKQSKKSKAVPQEGWGFCVCGVSHFITGETRNRPGKAFEARGGVCGNRLCGYLWCQLQYWDRGLFPGLGLCLSAVRETSLDCISECWPANHRDAVMI